MKYKFSEKFMKALPCKIYFAARFRAKFILRRASVQNLFCGALPCKIYFAARF